MWLKTVRLYRRSLGKEAIQMLSFVLSASNAHYLYSPLTTLLVPLVLYLANGTVFPISVLAIPIFLQVYNWVYLSIPPSVLYLSQACPESIAHREELERQVHPYRVLALFAPSIADRTRITSFQRNLFDWDNLWVKSNIDWKPNAFSLIKMAPAIVVDTRYPSHATNDEIEYIIDSGFLNKTLFVAERNNLSDVAVEAMVGKRDSGMNVVVSMDEVTQRLRNYGIVYVNPPPSLRGDM
jgi:hypothetical protein